MHSQPPGSSPFGPDELRTQLQRLTGQPLPLAEDVSGVLAQVAKSISDGQSLGHSQFNELLLNVGYDRVDLVFFLYLCDPSATTVRGEGRKDISSPGEFARGVDAFRELALLLYGNVKYAFKSLSRNTACLSAFVEQARSARSDRDLRSRHEPLVPLKLIEAEDAHLLGYLSGAEINERLRSCPDSPEAQVQKARLDETIDLGRWNHNVYLTFDHLDVYVATSMREKHEYAFVRDFMKRIQHNPHIEDLRLRIFDPTAAYCANRVDKGLAEALMLKRAACTVYLAQESDTLGKDSELASTLAQGKPVIAYVPEMSEDLWKYLCQTFEKMYPNESEEGRLLRILRIYAPGSAWTNQELRDHLSTDRSTRRQIPLPTLIEMVKTSVATHYEKRADSLKEKHPLGLQTNLSTGVANGVLVVRKTDVCAQLIKRIILNQLEFDITDDEDGYVYLREKLSKCIFRVMTGDRLLMNSFWNFYPARTLPQN